MKQKTNRTLLKQWFKEQKKLDKDFAAHLIKKLNISTHTLHKILYSEGHCPNRYVRAILAEISGIKEEKLFPYVGSEKEAA